MSQTGTAVLPAIYTIDPAHSTVNFAIRHFMVAYVRGGFSGVNGTVVFDAQNPSNSKVEASIYVTTLLSHDTRRDAHIQGADLLNTANHPKVTFVSKQVAANGPNHWKVTGDLTLRGVTKETILDVETAPAEAKDPMGNIRNGVSATTTLKRGDFGMVFNVPLETGGFMLSEDVHIQIDLQLIRKQ